MVTRKPANAEKYLPATQCKKESPRRLMVFEPLPEDGKPDIRYVFVSPPKFVIGTTVPEPVYYNLLDYPGGISKFYEEALARFDGDLDALLRAAAQLVEERKRARHESGIRNVNGRVSKAAIFRLQQIERALADVRGMSRAKVLVGLIGLHFSDPG